MGGGGGGGVCEKFKVEGAREGGRRGKRGEGREECVRILFV